MTTPSNINQPTQTPVSSAMPSVNMSIEDLQRHFCAQRASASRLIEQHNQMLTSMLNAASGVKQSPQLQDQVSSPVELPRAEGKVISLFDYAAKVSAHLDIDDVPDPAAEIDYHVFEETDAAALAQWGDTVDVLLKQYGADDALAVNRKQMASQIFLSSAADALFYFKNQFGVMFAVCYVGPDESYSSTLAEVKAYAARNDLLVNLMAQSNRVEDLQANGFSTTPMGIWQKIDPISNFTLEGSAMRRLRYLVNKYAKLGECKTIEYLPGSTAATDEDICRVIDQWLDLKQQTPPFIAEVKQRIMRGEFSQDHRFFLTYRDANLDNVMVFSRDNMNDGYLMDLEFYAAGLPLGSTEFALTEIISCFAKEGRRVVSLGLTMGTELFVHENGSEDVNTLFESLRKADYLNGDANAQYKNKYRPVTTAMYLARPHGCGKKKLNDLMMLLGTG